MNTIFNKLFIIIDDCSTDDSYKKAKKFEKIDKRVKIIKLNKNYGYSKAKNEGIIESKGEYIVTLDADDMLTKNSIEIRLKAVIDNNVSFIYADAIKIIGDIKLKDCYNLNLKKIKKERTSIAIYDPSEGIYNIHAQTIMIRRYIFEKYGLFDENLRSRSDREMWWRIFGKNNNDIKRISSYYLNRPVAYYRAHPFSMWRKRKRNKNLDQKIIMLSEKAYEIRKKYGITKDNTRFLEK